LEVEAGVLDYEDVREYYQQQFPNERRKDTAWRDHFRNDCEHLERYFRLAEYVLLPFFLPLPTLEFHREAARLKILSGRRPVAVAKNKKRERIPERLALAKFVADQTWPSGTPNAVGAPLFPKVGRVYAGHGSTVCIFFHHLLCDQRVPLPNLTVYTASFEVAALLYYVHQNAGVEAGGIRFGENLRVDRTMGSIVPWGTQQDLQHIDVAIISLNGIERGQFFSDADKETHKYASTFLDKADRIVIIAEHWKIGQGNGYEFKIPGLGEKPIALVTDASPEEVDKHLPKTITPILAPWKQPPASG
jgi:hypothetical protein